LISSERNLKAYLVIIVFTDWRRRPQISPRFLGRTVTS
jgi:hypothetical protein